MCHFLSLEMSSSSCHVILLPRSAFLSVVWLPRPIVIFPAIFAPLTIVLDRVLWGEHGSSGFNTQMFFGGKQTRKPVSQDFVAVKTWSQCFSPSASAGWAEVLFVLLRKQRSWRWTEGSGSSAGAFWRSPPSRSSPPHQTPLLSAGKGVRKTKRLIKAPLMFPNVKTVMVGGAETLSVAA